MPRKLDLWLFALLLTACIGDPPKVLDSTEDAGPKPKPKKDAGLEKDASDDEAGKGGRGGAGGADTAGAPASGGSGGAGGSSTGGGAGGTGGTGGTGGAGGTGSKTSGVEVCQPSVKDGSCNLVSQCGCPEDQSCYVTKVDGATATTGCVSDGRVAAGSLCDSYTACTPGHACVGVTPGGTCRAFCESDKDCGNGVCETVRGKLNDKPVDIEGYRVCFERCSSNDECATGCCAALASGVKVCGAASFCQCNSDADCNDGCCVAGPTGAKACLSGKQCETVAVGEMCTSNGMCMGYRENSAMCVNDDQQVGRCAATCTANSGCNSGCCATTTQGNRVCGPAMFCASGTNSCLPAGATCDKKTDCCGGAQNTSTCVTQNAGPVCQPYCTSNSECSTGCCAALKDGGNVCAPVVYCQ